jgi:hypothetical protein
MKNIQIIELGTISSNGDITESKKGPNNASSIFDTIKKGLGLQAIFDAQAPAAVQPKKHQNKIITYNFSNFHIKDSSGNVELYNTLAFSNQHLIKEMIEDKSVIHQITDISNHCSTKYVTFFAPTTFRSLLKVNEVGSHNLNIVGEYKNKKRYTLSPFHFDSGLIVSFDLPETWEFVPIFSFSYVFQKAKFDKIVLCSRNGLIIVLNEDEYNDLLMIKE